jgi:hypothetical protein
MKYKKNFGPQSIEKKLEDLLKPMLVGGKKEFILINNLVKNWREIVGKKYAEFCYPKSVSLGKESGGGKLTIGVYNASIGFFLEGSSDLVIERIASFCGFRSISKIIIKQEPKIITNSKIKEIKLSKAQEDFLSEKICDVEDVELAKTLQNLGRKILDENTNSSQNKAR